VTAASGLGPVRRAGIGTESARTREPSPGNVAAEGGGIGSPPWVGDSFLLGDAAAAASARARR
jgi:hypothetical protein